MKHEDFPLVLQETTDCGAASLCSVARFYGMNADLPTVRAACNTNSQGATLFDLEQAAIQIGFEALSIKANFNKIKTEVPLPFIAHLKSNHYVVVFDIDDIYTYVADPSMGLYKSVHQGFLEFWVGSDSFTEEGVALLLFPSNI